MDEMEDAGQRMPVRSIPSSAVRKKIMNKWQPVLSALNKSIPHVADNPDHLPLFVDSVQLVATSAASMSWGYR